MGKISELREKHLKERVLADLAWYVEHKKERREQAFKVYFFNERWGMRKGMSMLQLNLAQARLNGEAADRFNRIGLYKKVIKALQQSLSSAKRNVLATSKLAKVQ